MRFFRKIMAVDKVYEIGEPITLHMGLVNAFAFV